MLREHRLLPRAQHIVLGQVVYHVHLGHVCYYLRIILNVLFCLIRSSSILATVSYSAIHIHGLLAYHLFPVLLERILLPP